jgi:glycosyltransferase involved in cell wall biosynthesis
LKLALDATYSVGKNLSGVGVYSRELMAGLAEAMPDVAFEWCYRAHRFAKGLKEARPENARIRLLVDGWLPRGARLFHGLNQRMPGQRFRHAVCTFHDLFVMTAEYSTREFRERFTGQAKEAAGRSDLIICVSQFTAGQVESLLGVERARLRVVAHGVRFPERVEWARREPMVLHVGAIQKRKNLVLLVEAFERGVKAPWRLCLAGSAGYGSGEVMERIARSPARDRIDTPGWVSDEVVAGLYERAAIFAFPSLDEGFGIPVLEAMAQGVPVMAANRPAVAEVCGDAALLLEARDSEAWECALREWTSAALARERLVAAGLSRASAFTWKKAVDETLAVYREMAPGI